MLPQSHIPLRNDAPPDRAVRGRLGHLTRALVALLAYLGGAATLCAAAVRGAFRPADDDAPFVAAVLRQSGWMLAMGAPLVALVHVGLGSFLSMQAYFGGTFVDGTGAVVGVGLIRNLAPLMTGMVLAGLLAARTTGELRASSSGGDAPAAAVDYGQPAPTSAPARAAGAARSAAVRITAATLVGLVLTLWGVLVGTIVGWEVAGTLLGVSSDMYFFMFFSMLWVRDVVGLVFKGAIFAAFGALFACHEGLRPAGTPLSTAACRAACVAGVAILIVNSGWFLLAYHAGPAFGPTLMAPPSL